MTNELHTQNERYQKPLIQDLKERVGASDEFLDAMKSAGLKPRHQIVLLSFLADVSLPDISTSPRFISKLVGNLMKDLEFAFENVVELSKIAEQTALEKIHIHPASNAIQYLISRIEHREKITPLLRAEIDNLNTIAELIDDDYLGF